MKNVKNLKITTLEGFSVKNLQRFPSMEWGEDGGLKADLFYNDKQIAQIFDAGDGGCANTHWTDYGKLVKQEVKEKVLKFLQRVDKNYQDGSKYHFLVAKTPEEVSDDDILTLIINLEEQYERMQFIKKAFKKGYKSVAILSNEYEVSYLQYYVDNITMDEVKQWLVKNNHKEYTEIEIVRSQEQLATM